MDAIENKQAQRYLYLKRLYEKGCVELQPCAILETGRELGWDDATTNEVEDFLVAERLIRFPNFGQVCITHSGKKVVEDRSRDPNQTTMRIPTVANSTMRSDSTNSEQAPTGRQAKSKLLPIALFLIGVVLAIVINAASSTLPQAFGPYLWLSWPLLILLAVISMWLIRKQ